MPNNDRAEMEEVNRVSLMERHEFEGRLCLLFFSAITNMYFTRLILHAMFFMERACELRQHFVRALLKFVAAAEESLKQGGSFRPALLEDD
jgi:hypothetical protein